MVSLMWPVKRKPFRTVKPTYATPPLIDVISTTIYNRSAKGFRYLPGALDRVLGKASPQWHRLTRDQQIDLIEILIEREELDGEASKDIDVYLGWVNGIAA